jgi:hypothetical protein
MATWFAQTNTANINSANMWNSNPAGGGTVLTWPPASGDVLMANGKTVYVNANTNLGATGEVRNDTTGGATAGGFFQMQTTGVSLTSSIPAAGQGAVVVQCLTNGITVYIVGNITHVSGFSCVRNGGTGTINITGTVNSTVQAITNGSTGTINITGDLTCIGAGGGSYAVDNGVGGTVNVTGTATFAGSGAASVMQNRGIGTFNHTGNCLHSTGSTGTRGAAYNSGTGTLTVSGYVLACNTGPGAENTAQGILQVGETRSASNGRGAVTGAFRYASATAAKDMPYTADGQISMSVLDVAAIVPAESDVRKSVIYGDGAYTGTLQLGRNRTSMAGRF